MRLLLAFAAAFFTFSVLTIGVSAFSEVGEVELAVFGLIAVAMGLAVWRSKDSARAPR